MQVPTDYFPPDEFERIMAATYIRRGERGGEDLKANRARLRSMTLLIRWSRLRIGDAVTLEWHRLHADSLLLYQAKTRTPVYVPLRPHVEGTTKMAHKPGRKTGTRYVREHNGKSHEVTVLDDGFQYEGRNYRSLTEIATAITGSKWSGPAFFGLKRRS